MPTRAQIEADLMNPDINPLIPGGKSARSASAETFRTDNSAEGVRRRAMSPFLNPLVPDSPICKREAQRICEGGNLDDMSREQIKYCNKLFIADHKCPCGE